MTGSLPKADARRWLVAGTGLVLLLLAAVGVVALVALEGSEEHASADASVAPRPSADDRFGPEPGLCEAREHFAPVLDIVPVAEVVSDIELGGGGDGLYQRGCIFRLADASALGHLTVSVAIYNEPQEARNHYRDLTGSADGFVEARDYIEGLLDVLDDLSENRSGGWEKRILRLNDPISNAEVRVIGLDGGLVVDVVCYAHDLDLLAAVEAVAENLREALRR